jgi:hypothetical protein
MAYALSSSVKLSLLAILLATVPVTVVSAQTVNKESLTVAHVDVDADGVFDSVKIVLSHGEFVDDGDDLAACGMRAEGDFVVRVLLHTGTTVETPLNKFFGREGPLSFCARKWHLQIADYNADGHPDFNLGQFGTSNGWVYRLFTILPTGEVDMLPVPDEELFIADSENSTREIRLEPGGFSKASFDNCCEDNETGWWTVHYRWNAKLHRFEVSSKVRHGQMKP